jgi:hypothetical protein
MLPSGINSPPVDCVDTTTGGLLIPEGSILCYYYYHRVDTTTGGLLIPEGSILRYYYYHQVDTTSGGLLILEGIILCYYYYHWYQPSDSNSNVGCYPRGLIVHQ